MANTKDLPRGQYIFFSRLTTDITAEKLAEFLWTCGLDVSAAHISVRTYNNGHATAILSVPAEATANLLNLCINKTTLDGTPIVAEHFSHKP